MSSFKKLLAPGGGRVVKLVSNLQGGGIVVKLVPNLLTV